MSKFVNWQDVKRAQRISKRRRIIRYISKFNKYILPFCLSVVVWVILQFVFPKNSFNITNANYILSSIAQGLASLVALLFVIIFFICQATNKISIFSHLLNPDGFFLLGLFVISILFPIIAIKISHNNNLVSISISLCSFCLYSLFPFIVFVKNTLVKFGIPELIANLGILQFPQDNFKYAEFIFEIARINPKVIVKLEPEMLIYSLIEILEKSIKSETNFPNKASSMGLLAQIGVFALIEKSYKRTFNDVKQMISKGLEENIYPLGSIEILRLSCGGMSTILSELKLHKKLDIETRQFFANVLIRSLIVLFNQMKDQKIEFNKLKRAQGILHGQILAYLNREVVFVEDFKFALNDTLSLFEIPKKIKDDFKEYFEKLLSSK